VIFANGSWRRWPTLLFVAAMLLPCLTGPVAGQTGQRAPDSRVLGDTTTSVRLLPFHTIDAWAALTDKRSVASASDSRDRLARALGQFFGAPVSNFILSGVSLSPLEWPAVLAGQEVNPRRQRLEMRLLMSEMGIQYREVVPLDIPAAALADTIASAIAEDSPIVTNTPRLSVIYGYDRREPDTWWRVDCGGATEIVLESERMGQLILWNDDPAAGVMWIVTGREGLSLDEPRPDLSVWARLHTIAASVRGVPGDGIRAYPLSLRDLREQFSASDSTLSLSDPIDSTDPLGIRGARGARENVVSALNELTQVTIDTTQTRSLKLAQYHFSNSIRSLNEMDTLLYGEGPGNGVWAEFLIRSRQTSIKGKAAALITDILESEKQASEAIDRVLAAHDQPPTPPEPKKQPPPRRHRR
jgi:hypothetical protein